MSLKRNFNVEKEDCHLYDDEVEMKFLVRKGEEDEVEKNNHNALSSSVEHRRVIIYGVSLSSFVVLFAVTLATLLLSLDLLRLKTYSSYYPTSIVTRNKDNGSSSYPTSNVTRNEDNDSSSFPTNNVTRNKDNEYIPFPSELDEDNGYVAFPLELKELVRRWEERYENATDPSSNSSSVITVQEAQEILLKIIRSEAYKHTKPSHGIAFVKTHKTGSSTVAAVLHALATAHGLSIPVIPRSIGFPGSTWHPSESVDLQKMLTLPSTVPNMAAPFDIWTNHIVYDNALLDQVMVPNATIVSIVRDPATRIRSACAYYGCCPSRYDDPTVWERYILHNEKAKNKIKKVECIMDGSAHEVVGTGFNKSLNFDENFETFVERVQSGEILLLVMERMTESMLAFQQDFQLHLLDVAFVSQKVRERLSEKDKTKDCLEAEQLVRTWNPHDMRLHNVANEILTERMSSMFANRVDEAIWLLEGLNDLLYHSCSTKKGAISDLVLANWCMEKKLDNIPWISLHAKRLGFKHRFK